MNEHRHTPKRYVHDAARFFQMAEKALQTARRSGAKHDDHLERLEQNAGNMARWTRQVERQQA